MGLQEKIDARALARGQMPRHQFAWGPFVQVKSYPGKTDAQVTFVPPNMPAIYNLGPLSLGPGASVLGLLGPPQRLGPFGLGPGC